MLQPVLDHARPSGDITWARQLPAAKGESPERSPHCRQQGAQASPLRGHPGAFRPVRGVDSALVSGGRAGTLDGECRAGELDLAGGLAIKNRKACFSWTVSTIVRLFPCLLVKGKSPRNDISTPQRTLLNQQA